MSLQLEARRRSQSQTGDPRAMMEFNEEERPAGPSHQNHSSWGVEVAPSGGREGDG